MFGSILPDVHWTGILDPSEYIDSHRQWGSWPRTRTPPSGSDNLYQKSFRYNTTSLVNMQLYYGTVFYKMFRLLAIWTASTMFLAWSFR